MGKRLGSRLGKAAMSVPLRAPWLTLLVLVALTVATGVGLRYFSIDAEADALLLENDPDLAYYDETRAALSSDEFIIVAVELVDPDKDWIDVESLLLLEQLVELFGSLQGVDEVNGEPRVESLLRMPLFRSPPPQNVIQMQAEPSTTLAQILERWREDADAAKPALDGARDEVMTHRVAVENLISTDGRVANLLVYIAEREDTDELVFAEAAAQAELEAAREAGEPTAELEAELARLSRERRAAYDHYSATRQQLVEKVRQIAADPHAALRKANYPETVTIAAAENGETLTLPEVRMYLSGLPFLADEMVRMLEHDIRVFGSLSLLFLALVLFAFFARLRWVFVPVFVSGMVVVWVIGTMSWFEIRLTIVTANIVSLLFVISMAHTIHLIVRYREIQEKHSHLGTERLRLMATMRRMWRPCAFTALTTGVGFASLSVSDITPVMRFGQFMGIGTLVSLLASFAAFPALVLVLGSPRLKLRKHRPVYERILRFKAELSRRGRFVIPVLVVAVLAGSWVGIQRLHVETRIIDYFLPGSELRDGLEAIDRNMGGTSQLEVILDVSGTPFELHANLPAWPDDLELPEGYAERLSYDEETRVLTWHGGVLPEEAFDELFAASENARWRLALRAFRSGYFAFRENLEPGRRVAAWLEAQEGIGKVMGAHDFYGVLTDTLDVVFAHNERFYTIAADFAWMDLVGGLRDSEMLRPGYISHDGTRLRVVARVQETAEGLERNELLSDLRAHLAEDDLYADYEARPTGVFVLYTNMINSLMRSQYTSFGIVFGAVFLMLMLLFRSPTLGLLGMLPNVVPIAVVLAIMGFAGIPLNIITVSIAAIALGIGVDGTIHYVERLREEYAIDHDLPASVKRAHATIGRAILITALSVIGGLLIMLASLFTPTIYFGLFTAIAMAAALIGTLTILPAMIMLVRPHRALLRGNHATTK